MNTILCVLVILIKWVGMGEVRKFHIEKHGKRWVGREEQRGAKLKSSRKNEVLQRIRDRAKLHRPSEVIIHESDGKIIAEWFDEKKESKNSPPDFLTD